MDFIKHKVEAVTQGNGTMIYRMGLEKKLGQTDPTTKENTMKEQKKEKVSTNTLTAQSMKVTGARTKSKVQVLTLGQMENSTLVNGKTTICMAKESLAGLIKDSMKENILMIRKKGLGYILGQMVDNMLDNGKMDNNMAKVFIKTLIKQKEQESGKRANEWPGLMMMILKNKWMK